MNRLNIVMLILASTLLYVNTVFARIKVPIGEIEVLTKVSDLPDTKDFLIEEGHYLDLASLHTEFNIAYILPLWIIKEPRLVGYDQIDDTYFEIEDVLIKDILIEQKLDKASLLSLPFYNKYGGKMIAGLIIILLIFGMIPSKKRKIESKEV